MNLTPIDEEHLRLLKIFHYVLAGIAGVFSLFPLLHVGMGLMLVFGGFPSSPQGQEPPPPEFGSQFGWIFVIMGSCAILFGLTLASLLFFAARCIGARRRHTFCLVVAGLSCFFAPLGTLLGVFTLVVLLKVPVKAAFDGAGTGVRRHTP